MSDFIRFSAALALALSQATMAASPDSVPASSPNEVPSAEPKEVSGHPLTSVVVTQCNLLVAVYMTMPDGKLIRLDKSSDIPFHTVLSMASSATRSERIEVACNQNGAEGFQPHDPL